MNKRNLFEVYFEDELLYFKNNNVKIHCFYLAKHAKADFNIIATTTGGEYGALDINDPVRGAETLTNLVAQKVLSAAGGGGKRSAELVEAYKNTFMHT